jgi:regulator of chromosome condensation
MQSSDGLLGFDGKPGSSKTQITPLPIPSLTPYQFVAVACGTDHVVALTTAGHVYTWGSGQAAQLGRRIIERRKVNGLSPERLALRNIVLIGTGSYHSFAVNAKGVVFAWGLNSLKQTGVSEDRGGDEDIIWQPTEVDALNPAKLGGRKVVQISGGDHHSLFLLDDGSVWGSGRCDGREVGLADDHPAMKDLATRKDAAREAIAKAANEAQEMDTSTNADREAPAQEMDTTINADGEAPALPAVDEFIPEPVPILFPPPPNADNNNPPLPTFSADMITTPPINPIAHLSAGTRHNLAVSRDGNAYSWGSGNGCELGLGPDIDVQPVPSRVKSKAMDGWKVEVAGAGGQHCVLLAVKSGEV